MSLYPHKMYPDVTHITVDELRGLGLRALLLDIDGTLMPTRASGLSQAVLAWLESLRSAGIGLYILSNSRRDWRVRELGEQLGLPWAARSRKPRRGGYRAAIAALGLPPHEIGMVGDQIFTDCWGANRAGVRALLVESTDTDLWYQPLRRIAELPFMREKR